MTTTTRGTAMRRKKPDFVHEYLDRHGKPRIYLRRPGQKRVPLIGPLYSDAFWKAYHAAMAGDAPLPSPGSAKTKPGSMSAVIVGYYGSVEFKTLAVSTKGNYRRILERFREKHGDKPVALLETRHVNAMIDAIADKPAAANHLRKRLHTVMEYAIGAGYRTDNPISRAKRVKYKTRGYRTWTESDIAAFRKRWALKTPQRVAMELLLHTGLRRSDIVRLGPRHVEGDCFRVTIKKSQELVELVIPIHAALKAVVDRTSDDAPAFILTAFGKPRTDKAFTNWFREAAHEAGLPSNSSPHGMRKAACRRLAEAGCTPHQIQSITGHQNLKEIETYTKAVEQAALAKTAMASVTKAFHKAEVANPDDGLAEIDFNALILKDQNMQVALPRGLEPLFSP
jgi:site-specific recombinase XerD